MNRRKNGVAPMALCWVRELASLVYYRGTSKGMIGLVNAQPRRGGIIRATRGIRFQSPVGAIFRWRPPLITTTN